MLNLTKLLGLRSGERWSRRTLVVGPAQPVDGDSVSCTKALIEHLRKKGLEAYTLPTLTMYGQLKWILRREDYHPAGLNHARDNYTTGDLQRSFDAVLADWHPDEIVLVDGHRPGLGFDPRGVPVYTIDHHIVHGIRCDDEYAYIQPAPSAGCLLIERFGVTEPILAVSILTDTFWLRQNQPAVAAKYLAVLVDSGLDDAMLAAMQEKLMNRKDPAILSCLACSDVRFFAEAVFASIPTDDAELHRAVTGELGYFARHICVVRADGYASLRTADMAIDLRPLASKFGGGGHQAVAAAHLSPGDERAIEELYKEFRALVEPVRTEAIA